MVSLDPFSMLHCGLRDILCDYLIAHLQVVVKGKSATRMSQRWVIPQYRLIPIDGAAELCDSPNSSGGSVKSDAVTLPSGN